MIASILACPKCNTLIMEDTAICPGCHHVLKADHAALKQEVIATSEKFDGSKEIACRECEAMNRAGLVRCWQCGAFMQEEMERIYQQMQAKPASVISSDELAVEEIESEKTLEGGPVSDEGDFELAADVEIRELSSDEFETAEYLQQDESAEADGPIPMLDEPSAAADDDDDQEEDDDELLKLAVREEKELNRQSAKRKRSVAKGSFLIKGPCGDCKIRVQNYHQGMMGQCPKCALPFMVPVLTKDEIKQEATESGVNARPEVTLPADKVIEGARFHEIGMKSFKPKPQGLAGQGETVDLVQHDKGLLVVWPGKKGLLGASAKQLAKSRSEYRDHIAAGKSIDKLPAPQQELFTPDKLAQLQFVQPGTEDDFAGGVQLFADGMIVLHFPASVAMSPDVQAQAADAASAAAASARMTGGKIKPKKGKKPAKPAEPEQPPVRCLILSLSQYRQFRGWVAAWTKQDDALAHPAVPREEATTTWTCALSENTFEALQHPEYYQADKTIETTEVGWLCQCGEVAISEEARSEQKFGGKKPAGLTKAKCPKCEQPFGRNPLWQIKEEVEAPTDSEAASETEQADAAAVTAPAESDAAASEAEATAVKESAQVDSADVAATTAQGAEGDSAEETAAESAENEPAGTKSGGLLSRFRRKKSGDA